MKLVVDMQGAQTASRYRGIGRYSLSLTKELIRLAPQYDVDVHVLLNQGLSESMSSLLSEMKQLLSPENIHVWRPLPAISRAEPANIWRADASEAIREDFIRRLAPDAVHITSLFEGATDEACVAISDKTRDYFVSATSYDLIPLKNPDRYLPDGYVRKWYELKVKSLLRADALFAISESSRQEVIQLLNYDADSIVNVSSDTSDHFKVLKRSVHFEEVLSKFAISSRFVLYNGVISINDPRKNIANLMKGFALARKKFQSDGFQLVLSGGVSPADTNYLRSIADAAGLSHADVVFTGYVDDRELVVLHNASSLHVLPSMHEGFGLPLLEAMRCGAPAIASNCSSMPEVVGRQDALFDPASIDSIADCIIRFMGDESARLGLAEHAAAQQAKFSWTSTATTILQHLIRCVPDGNRQDSASDMPLQRSLSTITEQLDKKANFSESDLWKLAQSLVWNDSVSRTCRLYVDVTELAIYRKNSGIQRVVKSVVGELLAADQDRFDVCPVVRSEGRYFYATGFVADVFPSSASLIEEGVVAFGARDTFLGLDLDLQIDKEARETLLLAKQGGMRICYVVYDVLPFSHPAWFSSDLFGFFRWHYEKLSELADAMFCISDTVAAEVGAVLDQISNRIDQLPLYSFRLGSDFASPTESDTGKSTDRQRFPECYLLMVGTLEPRKGYREILLAMEEIWDRGSEYSLVIVGKEGWLCEEAIELIESSKYLDSRLVWIKGASDSVLRDAYENAAGLIAASYDEGFGLPIVEAGSFGVPLFLRDIPVFREVAGEYATYFSNDSESIARKLEHWIQELVSSSAVDSEGIKLSSWKESSAELMHLIVNREVKPEILWKQGMRYLWSLKSIFALPIDFPHEVTNPFNRLIGESTDEGFVALDSGEFHIVTAARSMRKGSYELVVKFGNSTIHQSVLVGMRVNRTVVLPLAQYNEGNLIVTIPIMFEQDVDDVEVEVLGGSSIGLCLESIEMQSLENEKIDSVE